MPTPPVDERISIARKAAIEGALKDGFSPLGARGGLGSAVEEAARRLQMKSATLASWAQRQDRALGQGKPNHAVDWSIWQVRDASSNIAVDRPRKIRRYLLTAAQDDTAVHLEFWRNLNTYAAHLGAEIMVGGFTYQKGLFEDHASRTAVFAEAVQAHMRHERVDLGPLIFCAEMNILPTAVRPLSSLESYTGQKWGVFPHAKVQLVSVPTFIGSPAKQIMTTGACTIENYIAKKAGLKAEFHHVIGATVVEIDENERVFCRQINATGDGAFQDLDVQVKSGRITTGCRVEAITHGDIHRVKIDPLVAMGTWGLDVASEQVVTRDTMIDALKPRYQFFHDLVDFDARNHHRIDDHHHRFAVLCNGTDSVEAEIAQAARFLRQAEREFCRSVVVFSNHDDALTKWVRTADYKKDAANALFYLRCDLAVHEAIAADERFNVFRWALERADGRDLDGIDFVDDDQSFVICQAAGGVECGMHGHLGINGARGSPAAFTKTAVKINSGHTHSPGILDGVYTAGLSGVMDQGYNRGLSSWANAHTVTYPNGKRTIVTLQDGKWKP
jgi:hypothetical protein